MKKALIILLIMLCPLISYSQTVRIFDSDTLQPIEKVFVYSKSKRIYTNADGQADISGFKRDERITFQHPSYHTFKTSFADLEGAGFQVRMKEYIYNINIVVTSASRWEQDKKEVPNKISLITEEEVEFNNPQTAADLLGTSEEVYIQKSQLGGGSPVIRGFATSRVLLVVDGVRMNNAIFRGGNVQNVISLDANGIESAEVIFGPGSVVYGSDAIGGVMDFHTLSPELSSGEELVIRKNIKTRYSSANTEKTGHFDLSIGGKKFGLLSSVTFSDYEDLRMGSRGHDEYRRPEYAEKQGGRDVEVENENPNVQRGSEYDQVNLMQKLVFKPAESWLLSCGLHYARTSDVPRYDRLIEKRGGGLRYGEWYYGPQKWMLGSLNAQCTARDFFFDDMKLVLAFQDFEESRNDRKFNDAMLYRRSEKVSALSLSADFGKWLDEDNILFYGAEVIGNRIGSKGVGVDITSGASGRIDSRYPDGSEWSSYSAYLNYKSNLSERYSLVAGLRYNRVLLNAVFDKTFYPFPFDEINIDTGALNGSLGLVYRPAESWQFNLNVSTGFRAPNIDDVGKVFESEPGSVVVPNKDLASEYAWNIDLAVIKAIAERAYIEVSGFYCLLKDAMVRRDFTFNGSDYIIYDGELSRVQAIQNADEATVFGGQLMVYAEIGRNLSCKSDLNITRGETRSGEPLQHVPPLFGSAHLTMSIERFKADFSVDFNGEIPFGRLAPSEIGKPQIYAGDEDGNPYSPAWVTLNLMTSYQWTEHLQLTAGVENLLDARYRPYASGICAPGINVIIGLRLSD